MSTGERRTIQGADPNHEVKTPAAQPTQPLNKKRTSLSLIMSSILTNALTELLEADVVLLPPQVSGLLFLIDNATKLRNTLQKNHQLINIWLKIIRFVIRCRIFIFVYFLKEKVN